jgi:Gametolysin peptidase M11
MKTSLQTILLFALTVLSGTSAKEGSLRSRSDPDAAAEADPAVHPDSERDLQTTPVTYSTRSIGTRSLYFVRVTAVDATPHSFTLQNWIETHFRTNGTSFKTVLEECSFGKLKVVSNGGLDVTVDGSYKNYTSPSSWLGAAIQKADQALGKSVYTMADHVVFCQPRNASWWTAIGPQNGNRINMHATTCMSLSVLVHEFGHNLNLLHSSQGGNTYGDYTGYMGASWGNSDGPRKCFNGYKNYQLRWYEDRTLTLTDFTTPRLINLATFADYDKTTTAHSVLLYVADMFFLQYNRVKGINSGTYEMKDLVTFTENTRSFSILEGGIGVGGSLIRPYNGKTLFVSVCERVDAVSPTVPDVMVITIGYNKNWCGLI